jgi:hypothetical protein
MNDSITPENKSTKRTLSLSIYGESSNAGTLYLNHLVNLDFFDRISAEDQVGPLMEESTVGVKDRNSFLRLTGYLRDQGAVGMITNLQFINITHPWFLQSRRPRNGANDDAGCAIGIKPSLKMRSSLSYPARNDATKPIHKT